MIVLIDNGHGAETPGKRSPDGRLLEWRYTRELAERLCQALIADGIDARRIVLEDIDVPLRQRVRRVNEIARQGQTLLVSIHVNAAGHGQWCKARGWSVYVSPNASTSSRQLASELADTARNVGLTVRQPSPSQKYWEQSLAMCRDTVCPAILTENLFMDNPDDLDELLTEETKCQLVRVHVEAIKRYVQSHK